MGDHRGETEESALDASDPGSNENGSSASDKPTKSSSAFGDFDHSPTSSSALDASDLGQTPSYVHSSHTSEGHGVPGSNKNGSSASDKPTRFTTSGQELDGGIPKSLSVFSNFDYELLVEQAVHSALRCFNQIVLPEIKPVAKSAPDYR